MMLSYTDYDTQTINEELDKNDSEISKMDYQSQADDLDITFHDTEKSSKDEEKRFEDGPDEKSNEVLLLFIGPVC